VFGDFYDWGDMHHLKAAKIPPKFGDLLKGTDSPSREFAENQAHLQPGA